MKKAKATKPPAKKPAGSIGDDAVRAKTGKTWKQWFAILDKAGADKMAHRDIATWLHQDQGVGSWWCQMVTVEYEKARGLRAQHERPDGYQISRSKTLSVPVSNVYRAWSDARTRARWLKDSDFEVRKATAGKSMRITWVDGKTSVEVAFYPKGTGRSQVVVQHSKLADAKLAERMKTYWSESLDRLQKTLES